MRSIKIAGLALASMLVMGMALAGNAAAAVPLWLLCLPWTNSPTRYTTNQCRTAEPGTGGWESVALGNKSDTVRILVLSLRLEDTKGELGAAVRVNCLHITVFGLIENRNLLLINEAKVAKPATECTAEGTGTLGACKPAGLEAVEGVHTPWAIETYTEETENNFRGRIKGTGNGEPGWKVKCAGVSDECTSESVEKLEEVLALNTLTKEETTSTLLVLGLFLNIHAGKCSVGGPGAGNVHGKFAILLWTGLGLSLNGA